MIPPPRPDNELERLSAVRRYDILDTPPEPQFDDLTKLAAYICGTPISAISLIDMERQWLKSRVGLQNPETSRDVAFCAYTILQPDRPLVVPDAWEDVRFQGNPLVMDDPNIRFYAGAPLVSPDGKALGALCVIDTEPRTLSEEQLDALSALGRQVMAQLELRRNLAQVAAAYREIYAADQAKGEFVSMVSHELRTPLTSIRGALQLVASDAQVAGENRDLLNGALDSSERLLRITEDILDLSKLEAGGLQLRRAPHEVAALIQSATAIVEHMPLGAGRVRCSVPAGLPHLSVDGDRLVQVFVNLLSNAIKYSEAGRPVEVSASALDDHVRIAVRDFGFGMTTEALGRLFRPFEQLAGARRVAGSTGLGLVITKRIVEEHGGTISVVSAPGQGSIFTVTLPVRPALAGPPARSE